MPESTHPTLEAVRALGPAIRAAADETERSRRLGDPLVKALREAGVFRLCVPASLGGAEVEPTTLVRVLETLSEADASTGWVLVTENLGTVPTGTYTITIGGFNNKKTFNNEVTQVLIDDVTLE